MSNGLPSLSLPLAACRRRWLTTRVPFLCDHATHRAFGTQFESFRISLGGGIQIPTPGIEPWCDISF